MDKKADMRAATRQLRDDMEAGIVDKGMFNEKQLTQIKSGLDKIEGYTWNYHQDLGRIQLILEKIRKDTGHVGGFEMWGGEKGKI
jgi:filamentous hemagglutinin